jgi:hypothetical protein
VQLIPNELTNLLSYACLFKQQEKEAMEQISYIVLVKKYTCFFRLVSAKIKQ